MQIPIGVFLPVSNLLILWYVLILLIISFDFVITVIVICFENSTAQTILYSYLNETVFPLLVFDVLISFNTGFIKEGKLIMDRDSIAWNYIRSVYFWVDLWAVGWSLIQLILVHGFQTAFPGLDLLIFLKVAKVFAIDSLIRKYILRSSSALLYYQIGKHLFMLTLVCHVFGSLFFFMDLRLIQAQWYPQSMLWVYNSFAYPDIVNQEFWIQYSYSFYFIIVTLSGVAYGDLVPLNPTETIYVFSCVTFPILIYAYLFSVIYTAIADQRSQRAKVFRIRLMAKYYFENLRISHRLRHKLLNYIAYYYKSKITSEDSFINDLAPSIRRNYKLQALQKRFDLTLFAPIGWDCVPEFVAEVVKQEYVPERYQLGKQHKLVYINQGTIVQFLKLRHKYSKTFIKGQFIGQYPFFTGTLRNRINVETTSFTVCQTIDYAEFKRHIANQHAVLNESYCLIRDQIILYGKVYLIRHQCFFCGENDHVLDNCNHLKGNIPLDQISMRQVRRNQGYNHKKFPRSKISSKKLHEIRRKQSSNRRKQSLIDYQSGFGVQTQFKEQLQRKIQSQVIKKWSMRYYEAYNIY